MGNKDLTTNTNEWIPLKTEEISLRFNADLEAAELRWEHFPDYPLYVHLTGLQGPLRAEYSVSEYTNRTYLRLLDRDGKFVSMCRVGSPEKDDSPTEREILLQSELDYYKGFHNYICEQSQRGVRE